MERVAIVGCIGAGKSTLARELGSRLGLPVVHLDRMWWHEGQYVIEPSAIETHTVPRDEYHALQRSLVEGDRWIIDGGVDGLEIRLSRADTVIFLDLPVVLCAWRTVRRTGTPRADYPSQVRESWRWTVHLVRWILWTFPRHRRPSIVAGLHRHRDHLSVIHLRRRQEVRDFVLRAARQVSLSRRPNGPDWPR